MIRLRTLLFSPANNLRMMYRAGMLGADAVILDLEDAVPMADKETARLFARDILPSLSKQQSAAYVRINALTTGLSEEDLAWVVQAGLAGIMLPKAESAADVRRAVELIDAEVEKKKLAADRVHLIPLLETARGVAAAREILAADPRVVAAAFGGVDFSRDMGVELSASGEELAFARASIALMAHAEGKWAVDTPWIDVHDRNGLVRHARAARRLGFHGKLLIHPNQVAPVNEVFSPSEEALAAARKIVDAFEAARARGAGAISLDGKMIDEANYRQAADLLAFGETLAKA